MVTGIYFVFAGWIMLVALITTHGCARTRRNPAAAGRARPALPNRIGKDMFCLPVSIVEEIEQAARRFGISNSRFVGVVLRHFHDLDPNEKTYIAWKTLVAAPNQ